MAGDTLARIGTISLNPAFDLTIPLERLEPGEVNRAAATELRPAGKGINVSVMLSVLGEPSVATGLLGAEDVAAFEAFLRPMGVVCRFEPVPGRCRINVKVVETAGGRVTDINSPGTAATADAIPALQQRLLTAPELMVVSGSLPPGLPLEEWSGLMQHLAAGGRRIILDTSGPAFGAALPAKPFLVKPNRSELAAVLGRPLVGREALLQAALELQQQGIRQVVVSDGAEGALFLLGDARLWVRPPPVPLTTTVGAGDAMMAGLAAALARGHDAEAAARLATGCAAAAVSRPASALPAAAEITRLAAAAHVERL
jgi:1-phosphofructokinase